MPEESLSSLTPPVVQPFYRLIILYYTFPAQAVPRYPANQSTVWMNRITVLATTLTCFRILSYVHSFIGTVFLKSVHIGSQKHMMSTCFQLPDMTIWETNGIMTASILYMQEAIMRRIPPFHLSFYTLPEGQDVFHQSFIIMNWRNINLGNSNL